MTTDTLTDLSQGEIAYQRLHDAIRSGDFNPGDRVRETDVAKRLSLSRTPVREALRRLESDGIVEHRPRIGAVIRTLTHAEVVELYEMRIVLERTAAELAAKHGSGAQADTLEHLNEKIRLAQDNPQIAAAHNHDFHRCIYMATRNRFLYEAARGLNNALLLLGPTTLADKLRIQTVCAQHQDIITAIRAGDARSAGLAAETHLQTSLRHRLKMMRP